MTKDEALKMAIDALELINEHAFRCGLANDAIKACKEALAQPAQDPVAIVHRGIAYWKGKEPPEGTELYNAPTVQREGWVSVPIEPTEEMIDAAFVFLKDGGVENIDGDDIRGAIRYAIQAAPKE